MSQGQGTFSPILTRGRGHTSSTPPPADPGKAPATTGHKGVQLSSHLAGQGWVAVLGGAVGDHKVGAWTNEEWSGVCPAPPRSPKPGQVLGVDSTHGPITPISHQARWRPREDRHAQEHSSELEPGPSTRTFPGSGCCPSKSGQLYFLGTPRLGQSHPNPPWGNAKGFPPKPGVPSYPVSPGGLHLDCR